MTQTVAGGADAACALVERLKGITPEQIALFGKVNLLGFMLVVRHHPARWEELDGLDGARAAAAHLQAAEQVEGVTMAHHMLASSIGGVMWWLTTGQGDRAHDLELIETVLDAHWAGQREREDMFLESYENLGFKAAGQLAANID